MRDEFINRVKEEEGFSSKAYWDRKQWSIGYGCVASGPDDTITIDEAHDRLIEELKRAEIDYRAVFLVDPPGLTTARHESIVDMLFNMGRPTFLGFVNPIGAIKEGNWLRAAAGVQNSLYYKQVGNRAKRIVEELRTGYEYGKTPTGPSKEETTIFSGGNAGGDRWAGIPKWLQSLLWSPASRGQTRPSCSTAACTSAWSR